MKHPSIRFRLMLGTGMVVAVILTVAHVATYRAFQHTLQTEIDRQLLQSASLLAKSTELEVDSLDYEWQEAMDSSPSPDITGLFEFWDVKSGRTTRSPELHAGDLPYFHGELDEPVLRDIILPDGRRGRGVGLLHYPFADSEAVAEATAAGKVLHPEEHPQVLVCARETESVSGRLDEMKLHLIRTALGTLLAIGASIFAIFTWCLRPIHEFSASLLGRSDQENPPLVEIPDQMPYEITGLAKTFNITLEKVDKARAREKEFALHAAHELRTPVAGILATLEQAVHRPREAADLTRRIHKAMDITAGVTETLASLMRLARLRGRLEVTEKATFDPVEIIAAAIRPLQDTIANRGLQLQKDLVQPPPILVNDAGLFHVLVSNLIENAIHYTKPGSVIRFSARTAASAFIFETRNPCETIKPDDTERLFQPFQRGRTSAGPEAGHAGLGLSLAREAAHLLGGKISASVEEGEITFTATLPL